MNEFGRFFIMAGVVLLLLGAILMLAPRVPGLGRLPGDFSFQRGNLRIYVPLATSIIASIILTILLNLWLRR